MHPIKLLQNVFSQSLDIEPAWRCQISSAIKLDILFRISFLLVFSFAFNAEAVTPTDIRPVNFTSTILLGPLVETFILVLIAEGMLLFMKSNSIITATIAILFGAAHLAERGLISLFISIFAFSMYTAIYLRNVQKSPAMAFIGAWVPHLVSNLLVVTLAVVQMTFFKN